MANPKPRAKAPAVVERPVRYAEEEVYICKGKEALIPTKAQELLGWEEESDEKGGVKFGDTFLFQLPKDLGSRKVRCRHNYHNRPFNFAHCETLCQDILNGRWRFNFENIIIGRSGRVLSGQHRLVALVLAEYLRKAPKTSMHWAERWGDGPVKIDTSLAVGCPEDRETTRTFDTVRPRTLEDVLFTEDVFAKSGPTARKLQCKILSFAVRLLWQRTGADQDAFSPHRTHSESLDFVTRHPRVIEAVKHIWEESQPPEKAPKGKLAAEGTTVGSSAASKAAAAKAPQLHDPEAETIEDKAKRLGALRVLGISMGDLAGLLYLMGPSSSDCDNYVNAQPRDEKCLDWTNWERACEYFVMLGAQDASVKAVFHAIGKNLDPLGQAEGGSRHERMGIVILGWNRFVSMHPMNEKIGAGDVKLTYLKREDGTWYFKDKPTIFGAGGEEDPTGIDLGDSSGSEEEVEGEEGPTEAGGRIPTPEEIAARKKDERDKKVAALLEDRKKSKEAATRKKEEAKVAKTTARRAAEQATSSSGEAATVPEEAIQVGFDPQHPVEDIPTPGNEETPGASAEEEAGTAPEGKAPPKPRRKEAAEGVAPPA